MTAATPEQRTQFADVIAKIKRDNRHAYARMDWYGAWHAVRSDDEDSHNPLIPLAWELQYDKRDKLAARAPGTVLKAHRASTNEFHKGELLRLVRGETW